MILKKSAEKNLNKLFADFFVYFKKVYLKTFFFYFLFLFVVAVYNKLISFFTYLAVSGMSYDGLMFDFTAQNFDSYLVLAQLPVVYLFFVFVAYVLFEMLYNKYKIKDLFLVGLRQFVLFILFFFIAYLGYIFYVATGSIFAIILLIVLLFLMGLFIFSMLKLTVKNNLAVSLVESIKQIINGKTWVSYLQVLVFSFVILLISSLLVIYKILPETVLYFILPIVLIFVLQCAIKN